MKCYVVIPAPNGKEVRDFLDSNGISYSHDEGVIFANLTEIPPGLEDIAAVYDPVFCAEKDNEEKWCFRCPSVVTSKIDVVGPFVNEHRARVNFVQYISWSGEFVNNAHPRNDA